jgi:hypothetical protein
MANALVADWKFIQFAWLVENRYFDVIIEEGRSRNYNQFVDQLESLSVLPFDVSRVK